MKIVLIEDDKDFGELMSQVIEPMLGHEFYRVNCTEEAIELVKIVKPNVVLIDLILGHHEQCLTTAKQLKTLKGLTHRVILVSAISGLEALARKEGVEFLPKPFGLEELDCAIRGSQKPSNDVFHRAEST